MDRHETAAEWRSEGRFRRERAVAAKVPSEDLGYRPLPVHPRHWVTCGIVMAEIAPLAQPSFPGKAGNPVRRGLPSSIPTVSGILDAPPSRSMTTEYTSTFSR